MLLMSVLLMHVVWCGVGTTSLIRFIQVDIHVALEELTQLLAQHPVE